MKLCVSNIAWNKEENDSALEILRKEGINAIDVAPTLIFNSINNLTIKEIKSEYEKYKNLGFKIIAMQSLLYGLPPYSIFDGGKQREYIFRHLRKMLYIAKGLNIKNLVFGSPKNRFIKHKNEDNINTATDFFQKLCDTANKFQMNVCLEANPKEYNCNFITNTFEAVDFIKKVDRKNFLFNLDTSTIILNQNDFKEAVEYSNEFIGHVHISSPYIEEIMKINNEEISRTLKSFDYKGFFSLEMKSNLTENNLKNLEKNVKIFKKFYSYGD